MLKKTISLLPHITECALAAIALILAPLEPLHEIGVTGWKARLKRIKSLECSFTVACLQVLNASVAFTRTLHAFSSPHLSASTRTRLKICRQSFDRHVRRVTALACTTARAAVHDARAQAYMQHYMIDVDMWTCHIRRTKTRVTICPLYSLQLQKFNVSPQGYC